MRCMDALHACSAAASVDDSDTAQDVDIVASSCAQIRESMLWVWGESGPTAFIDSAAKDAAVTRVGTGIECV